MTKAEQERKRWLRYILNAVIFLTSIAIVLYIVAWKILNFDLLNMDRIFKGLQYKFPYLYLVVLLIYSIYAAMKHGAAYKNDHIENDLAWASILWILAAITVVLLAIQMLYVD